MIEEWKDGEEALEALLEAMAADFAADGKLSAETIDLVRRAVERHVEYPLLAKRLVAEAERRAGEGG